MIASMHGHSVCRLVLFPRCVQVIKIKLEPGSGKALAKCCSTTPCLHAAMFDLTPSTVPSSSSPMLRLERYILGWMD